LTILCLGGAGYIQYQTILQLNGIPQKNILQSYDYNISMAIKYTIPDKQKFLEDVIKIIDDNIQNFSYKHITYKNFSTEYSKNTNRIHIRVNFNSGIKKDNSFHILELSFWLNGKISDNFTFNDFYKSSLYLYKYNDLYYYLLPLELLVATTLYAIVDFYERRNFNKCIKYIERVKVIKDSYDIYEKINDPNHELLFILEKYKNKIKRKYKFINDYPFITSYFLNSIKDKKIVKCIYRKLRVNNRKNLYSHIKKYNDECLQNSYKYDINTSDNTLLNTDDEAIL